MSSGSEVALIVSAAEKLAASGIKARVVSLASHELFAEQTAAYRESVLPKGVPRVSIEAASSMSWYRWVGSDGVVLGVDRFGASAPYETVYKELGLTVEKVVEAAKGLVKGG
jgi:transketolase